MMKELIARLEAATEGTHDLDREIGRLVGWQLRDTTDTFEQAWFSPQGDRKGLPWFTTSIDAALTLVPEGWSVCDMGQGSDGLWQVGLWHDPGDGATIDVANAGDWRPAALALCIAALKARAA